MKVNHNIPGDRPPDARRLAAARHLHPRDREHLPPAEPVGLLHPARRAGDDAAQDRRGAARRLAQRADRAATSTRRTQLYKLGRIDRQTYGARFMLGARQPRRRRAATACARPRCETKTGTVRRARPTPSLGRGRHADQAEARPMRALHRSTRSDVRKSGDGLPGHDGRLHRGHGCANLAEEDAAKVAQFIRVSTTEGQQAGHAATASCPPASCRSRRTGRPRKLLRARPRRSRRPSRSRRRVPDRGAVRLDDQPPRRAAPVAAAPRSRRRPAAGAPVRRRRRRRRPPSARARPPSARAAIAMPETQAVSSDWGGRTVPIAAGRRADRAWPSPAPSGSSSSRLPDRSR